MCRRQSTITPQDVQRHTATLGQKHLRLKDFSPRTTAAVLWTLLCYACARVTSLADACSTLKDAPSDSTAHAALMATLPALASLQLRINRALQGDLPKALRQRPQPLAIDLTLIPYHGKPHTDLEEVYRSKAKHGTTHFHAYATAYVVRKGQRFTLALVYVRKGQALKDVVRELLRLAARAGVRPRYLLLDKEFCSVEVLRYLQHSRRRFLMPLPLRGRKADHPRGPGGSRVYAYAKCSRWSRYTLTNAKGKKATVRVCVKCRNLKGERGKHGRQPLVYAYGGGLVPGSYPWVQETYRKRFGIETSYRQLRQACITTSTRNPLLRLLYVGLALLLRNVWVWLHWEVLARKRRGMRQLNLGALPLRQLLLWLQRFAEQLWGVCEEIQTQRPIPT